MMVMMLGHGQRLLLVMRGWSVQMGSDFIERIGGGRSWGLLSLLVAIVRLVVVVLLLTSTITLLQHSIRLLLHLNAQLTLNFLHGIWKPIYQSFKGSRQIVQSRNMHANSTSLGAYESSSKFVLFCAIFCLAFVPAQGKLKRTKRRSRRRLGHKELKPNEIGYHRERGGGYLDLDLALSGCLPRVKVINNLTLRPGSLVVAKR